MALLLLLVLACAAAAQTPDCAPRDLAPAGSAEGELAATDCRFRDFVRDSGSDSYADAFRIAVTGPTVLTVWLRAPEFDARVHVCDAQLRCIGENDNAGDATDSRLAISLPAGVYYVLATSREPATGAYVIETLAEAPRSCNTLDLAYDQPANGSFTAGGCRRLDVISFSTDESYVQLYRLNVLRPAVANLEMTASSPAPALAVHGNTGARIASSGGTEGTSTLKVSLDAGTYTVMAGSGDVEPGGYSVRVSLEGLRNCPGRDLEIGAAVDGAITASDCRILDVWLGETDATYIHQYRIRVRTATVLTADMASTAVDPYLLVLDEYGEVIGDNDNAGSDTADARLIVSLPPGTYFLWANVARPAEGGYTLRTAAEAPHTCSLRELGLSESVAGTLDPGGCRVLDLIVPSADATPIQLYRTVVPSTGVLRIDMESGEFDPYLLMMTERSNSVWEDDNGGGGANARIGLLLTPGVYYVLAGTVKDTGAYTLRTEFGEPRACPISEAQPNGLAEGTLAGDECRLRDVLPGTTEDLPVGLFRITPPRAGAIRATVVSDEFEPMVLVMDAQYRIAAPDPYYPTGNPAVAIGAVNAEPYTVVVLTLNGKTGKYSLRTEFQ